MKTLLMKNHVCILSTNRKLVKDVKNICKKLDVLVSDAKTVQQFMKITENYNKFPVSVIVVYADDLYSSNIQKIIENAYKEYFIEIILINNAYSRSDYFPSVESFYTVEENSEYNDLTIYINSAFIKATLRRREFWYNQLQELSLKLNTERDVKTILYYACEAAVKMFKVDHSGLVVINQDRKSGITVAEFPISGNLNHGTKIKIEDIVLEEKLFNKGETVYIRNLKNEKSLGEVKDILLRLKLKSILIVPVYLFDQIIASISIDMINKQREFCFEEEEFLNKLSTQIAMALRNVYNYEKLEALQEIGQSLTSAFEFEKDDIFKLVYDKISKLMDAQNFYIALYDKINKKIIFHYVVEDYKKITSPNREYKPRKETNGLTEFVIKSRETLLISKNVRSWIHENNIQKIGKWAKTWLGAPLIIGKDVIGVLVVQNFNRENAFDEEDKNILTAISSQAALALNISNSFESEAKSKFYFESLQKVTATIADIELSSADTILDEIQNIIKYDKATIQLIYNNMRFMIAHKGFGTNEINKELLRPVSEDKLILRIKEKKKELILPRPEKDPDWIPSESTKDVKSWIGIPIIKDSEVKGLITLDSRKPNFYKNINKKIIERVYIKSKQLFDKISEYEERVNKISEIEVFDEIVKAINKGIELDEVLKTIVKCITEYIECEHCAIFLDEKRNGKKVLRAQAVYGSGAERIIDRTFKIGEGFAGWVYQNGETILSTDPDSDPRFAAFRVRQKEPRSMLVVPIKLGNRTIGLVSANHEPNKQFTKKEKLFVETIAAHAGIALEKAYLFEKEQKKLSIMQRVSIASSVFAGVSHQIRTPLNGIKGSYGYLKNFLDSAEEKIKDNVKIVDEYLSQLEHIMQVLSSYTKGIKLPLKKISLNTLIEKSLLMINKQINEKKAVIVKPDFLRERNVRVEEFTIEQVLTNLLSNAVDSIEMEGNITISIEDNNIDYYVISISDNGQGIPSDYQQLIFKEVYTSKEDGHLGLGLLLSYNLIKQNGGEIKLEKSNKNGTTFSIYLPKFLENKQ